MGSRRWWLTALAATFLTWACGSDAPPAERPAGTPSASPPTSSGVTATAYVTDVCGLVVDWTAEIQTLNQELREAGEGATSVQALKDAALRFFGGILDATDAMIADIEAAGVPDVPRGEEASQHLLDGLGEVRLALRDARDRVQALGTGDAREFATRLQAITVRMARALTSVGTTLAEFESPELDAAAEETGACEEIPT